MNNTSQYWQTKLRELEIIILIPTYNNAKTLGKLLDDMLWYAPHILVINDGSTDDTTQILSRYTTIEILTHSGNKGKGSALINGLRRAREQGYRYAITLDSDGQHFASDIPRFIQEIENNPDTFIIGARNLTAENMPGKNTFANKFSNFWYRLETGIKLQDTQSGYRLYPLKKIGSMNYYTSGYEFELEAIVFAAWRGVPVKNISINVYYPPKEERISHFRPLRDFTRISILNSILVLITFFWIWPRNFFRKLTWTNIKDFFYQHIFRSKESNARLTLAIMLGVFMGIFPVWGYQMLIAIFLSRIFRLNTVVTVMASNISIPPVMPFLIYGSYITGCKVLGRPVTLEFANISLDNIRSVLEQYLVGSIIFAFLCSFITGTIFFGIFTIFRKNKGRE